MSAAFEFNASSGFPVAQGDMERLIRSHDWSATPLGCSDTWSPELRSALSICLKSTFPCAIYWGQELRLIYNDAWAPIPAERHPWALGRPAAEVWSDIWNVVGPQFEHVVSTGEGFSTFDEMLPMVRDGIVRESYWNYSFTPILAADGSVLGIFNQGHETTEKVLAERRSVFLLELSDRLRALDDPRDVINTSQSELGRFFGANRVGYGDVDETGRYFTTNSNWTDGTVPSQEGTHDLAAFGDDVFAALQNGSPLVIDDVKTDARTSNPDVLQAFEQIQTRAAITASLVKNGRLQAAIYVHAREPRPWTEDDHRLVTEVADRTWSALDRIRANALLVASEEKSQTIVNSIDQMIWSTRPDGYHDFYNDRWYEYTGVPYGSTDGEAWNGMFHPEDQERAWKVWRHSLETGEPYHIEYRLRHRSGQYRWVIGRAQCTRDEEGNITRWYGTCTDIHDLKDAQGALAEQARVMEILNRTGNEIASEIDLEKVVQTVTDAGVSLTGAEFGAFFYNVQDRSGDSYTLYTISGVPREHFSKFPMPRNTQVFEPTFRGDGVVRSEDITKDPRYGKNAPFNGMPEGHLPVKSYLAVPVKSRSGTVIGGLFFGHSQPGIFTDQSEELLLGIAGQAAIAIDNANLFRAAQHEIEIRQEKELALLASEEFSRSVVESSGDCIKVLELDGSLQFMNENGCRLMEVDDVSQICGHPWATLWPEESAEEIEKAMVTARAGGVGRFSAFCPTAKGTPKWWDVVVTAVPGPDGTPVRLVSISRDVTEQKKGEEARQLLLRELHHRVKNLFAIASGMVSMTARSSTTVEQMSEALKGRLNALARAHELIRSAITSDFEQQENVLLRHMIEEVIKPHIDPNGDRTVQLDGPDIMLGVQSATSMALIFHELATNAAKYGALSTPQGKLNINWLQIGGRVELSWKEHVSAGTVSQPTTQGFGTKLARASAAGQLGGSIEYHWEPDGLRIAIIADASQLQS